MGEKDSKPKKKILATTLPPKTGAIYKESYKEKLRKDKEEMVDQLKKVDVVSKPDKQPFNISQSQTQSPHIPSSSSSTHTSKIMPSTTTTTLRNRV